MKHFCSWFHAQQFQMKEMSSFLLKPHIITSLNTVHGVLVKEGVSSFRVGKCIYLIKGGVPVFS